MKFLLLLFLMVGVTAFAQDPTPTPNPGPVPGPKEKEPGDVIYDMVDEPAEFPGGTQALRKFLADNLKYPERPLKDSVQGKCYVKLVITNKGEVQRAVLMKSVDDYPEFGKEALRVMYLMPRWKPAKLNGKNVNSYYRIPVYFK